MRCGLLKKSPSSCVKTSGWRRSGRNHYHPIRVHQWDRSVTDNPLMPISSKPNNTVVEQRKRNEPIIDGTTCRAKGRQNACVFIHRSSREALSSFARATEVEIDLRFSIDYRHRLLGKCYNRDHERSPNGSTRCNPENT